MENLEHFTLAHFKQLLEQQDQQTVQHYISQNFVVARHASAASFQTRFAHEPVVMDEMRILIVVRGSARPIINLVQQHFQAPELVYLGPNGLVQFDEVSPDAQGIGLSISNEFLTLLTAGNIPKAFDGHLRDFHFGLQPSELQFLDHLHRLIYQSMQLSSHSLQSTMQLIGAFLWQVDALYSSREAEVRVAQSREQRLFADFMQLIARHAQHEHHIDFYASQLCLSPRYMSSIINRVSGKPAKQWIDEAIIARVKVALRHSDKPLAVIADEMHFANTSFFTKYFKRLTGITPLQFRNSFSG
ncbi:MAG: AraC family transcriptional regulator [Muribaculaceae bacterium]|nr:AraC family transcriptional regulator [Muribaculaceae bacterium]